jgi:hypothetical protein
MIIILDELNTATMGIVGKWATSLGNMAFLWGYGIFSIIPAAGHFCIL